MTIYVANNVEQLKEYVDELCKYKRISHDTETKGPSGIGGLYPFHGSRAFAHVFATDKDEFYFNFKNIPSSYKKLMQPIFDDKERIIFYVNALFDNCILHVEGITNHARIVDCPSIARIDLNIHEDNYGSEESYLSMEYLAKYYRVQLKSDAVKKYIKDNNLYSPVRNIFKGELDPLYNEVPDNIIIPYGCSDARSTYDLGQKILISINAKDAKFASTRGEAPPMIEVAKKEIKLTSALLKARIEGMSVDTEYIENQIKQENDFIEKTSLEVKAKSGIANLNSGKQLANYLRKNGIELEVKETTEHQKKVRRKYQAQLEELLTKKHTPKQLQTLKEKLEKSFEPNYCTDKKAIAKIYQKNSEFEFLKDYVAIKEAQKRVSTYFENFLKFKDANNIIHADLNQCTTITGRMSCSNPNLQNLHKKDKKVKKSFKCLDKDFNWFFIDYSQQEMIVMLDQSEEMQIIYKLIDKVYDDFYLATSAVLLEIAGVSIDRQQAKAIALGIAYGQGDELLANNLNMPLADAKKFKAAFFKALPKLEELRDKLILRANKYGRIHNPFGRVSHFDRNSGYKALNSFIQGTSADITKNAVIMLTDFLAPYKSKLLMVIHDEIIFKIHKTERHLIKDIQRIMSEAYPHKHIPLSSEVEWADDNESWADKKPYSTAA